MEKFLLLCFLWLPLRAQTISGIVIDAQTGEPLAFANVVFNNQAQTLSDIEGKFFYRAAVPIYSVTCSYVGYKNETVTAGNNLVVAMDRSMDELLEVNLNPDENPASRIIEKTIANRQRNNPENLESFRYQCYNKMTFDFLYQKNRMDSARIGQLLKNSRLLLTESVSQRKFLRPHWSEEHITGTRFSGFQNPRFAALATDLQPFSFYQDHIKLFDIRYLNPITDGSLKKYRYFLEEEFYQEKDTVFIISFRPKNGKNFEGLEGLLYINSNGYAIQNVIASPSEKAKINIKIQQQYQFIGGHWFPEQLNYAMTIPDYPNKETGLYAEGKSYISQVDFDQSLRPKDFSAFSVHLAENAARQDSLFWQNARKVPLKAVEKNTYRIIDSLGQIRHFDRYLTLTEKIIQARYPLKYVDIDLTKILQYNQYEGLRLGAGLITNADVFRNFEWNGFLGYGLEDEKWKYGAGFRYQVKAGFSVGADYQDNLLEMGNRFNLYEKSLYNFRDFIGYQYDRIRQIRLKFHKDFRYMQLQLTLNQTATKPQYAYLFTNGHQSFAHYQTTTAALHIRYAFGEKKIGSFGSTFSEKTQYPVISMLFTQGFRGIAGGDFVFTQVETAIEHSFYNKNIGLSRYRAEAGYGNTSLPAGLLFTGDGSFDADVPLFMKNTFQVMRPYAFLSDRYANLFLSHYFGTLLFRNRWLQPEISIHHNMGWGQLSNSGNHHFLGFKSQEAIYTETGIKLDNLIKLNYANLGYLGLGVAGFLRYGAYTNPRFKDNTALKITLNFTIK